MERKQEEIVVLRQFDNSITANIVKTKLDAYGIPCFLTDENITNLYPGLQYTAVGFNIRLHLFAADVPRAKQILEENNLALEDENTMFCPRCQSRDVERDFPKKYSLRFFPALTILFLGVFLPEKKVYRCHRCELEFN